MATTTAAKPKVLMLGRVDIAKEAEERLSEVATLMTTSASSRAEFLAEARAGKYDGCVAAYKNITTNHITGIIDAEVVNALPKGLRFLASHADQLNGDCEREGAGYDHIKVDACAARDPPILVSHTPEAVDDGTADCTMFLLLGALRNFGPTILSLRRDEWKSEPVPAYGHDPQGKTLGILGMGNIGRNLKPKAEVFGMRVIYHNRRRLSDELAAGAEYVGFDELLARSDVLSLNLPLNEHTRHIIGREEFAKMKDGIVIVNTARGAVMDEAALVEALESGKVASAGLDVYENEPRVHPGLLANPNVLLLPHMGTHSVETQGKMEALALDNARSAVLDGKLLTPVPEHRNMSHS
ncbi:hypothetical protein KEM52_004227 [Ascosphaera acerosa]|nr:hypothetical protein KEM52_004227 [Ascosphaera acerosa]